MAKLHPRIKLLIKIGGAVLLLALVLGHVPLDEISHRLRQAQWPWLVSAFLCIHMAQLTSALRMQAYAASQQVALRLPQALRLYYQGMLYNLALPGGIGGDAYKAFVLSRRHGLPILTAGSLMLAERANGLWLLLLITATLLPALTVVGIAPVWGWLAALLLALSSSLAYWCVGRRITGESASTCLQAAWWSFWSQLAVLASVIFMLLAMQVLPAAWPAYGALFMLAAVAGILPITVAGVGVREAVYAFAAPLMAIDAATGVALSLAWFGLYVLASFAALLMPQSMDTAAE
jgi:uncharacterized membrane protein YbhN (UPF0104 family)